MRVFEGETQPTLNSITEAVAYDKLANGEDIFGRFYYKEHVDLILSHLYQSFKLILLGSELV